MLTTNWMSSWIPAISFIYAMPFVLQPPLAVFASAIWGVLVSAIGRQSEPGALRQPARLRGRRPSRQILPDPAD